METCDYSVLVAGIPGNKLGEPCSKTVLLKVSRNFIYVMARRDSLPQAG